MNRRWVLRGVAAMLILGIGAVAAYRLGGSEDAAAAATPPPQTVAAVRAEVGDVRAWIFADGTARAVRREYLTFEEAGRVTYVWPGPDGSELRVGATVPEGQVLARLDAREQEADVAAAEAAVAEARQRVEAARADVARSEADRDLARSTLERKRQLRARGITPAAEFEEAEAGARTAGARLAAAASQVSVAESGVATAEARLRQSRVGLERRVLHSPIAGTLAYLNIERGYYFTPGAVRTENESAALQSVPMVVIDTSAYEVTVDVPSYAADAVEPGQTALLVLGQELRAADAREDASVRIGRGRGARPVTEAARARGEVFAVSPAVNPGGRSVRVVIRTTTGAEALRDGLYVTAWIATRESRDAVLVPFNALVYREDEPFAFVVEPDTGVARRRAVTLGIRGLTAQEILEGVRVGELVVTEGRFRLTDGAPVAVVGERPAPSSGVAP